MATSCPILSVDFVKQAEIANYGSEWTKQAFSPTLYFVYTQTDSDAGPLGATYVGQAPCLDPIDKLSFQNVRYRYPLEIDKGQRFCTIEIEGAPTEDPRYRKLDSY